MISFASLLLAVAQPYPPEPMPAELHNFADWVVGCDNTLRCEAVSLVPERMPETPAAEGQAAAQPQVEPWELFGVLRVERDAGPDAPLTIILSDVEGTPTQLTAYDQPLEAQLLPLGEGRWRVQPANLRGFIDNLFSEPVAVKDASGRTLGMVAVDGLRSALLYMEERQGRLRTQGAVVRPGSWSNAHAAPARPLPVVQAAPRTGERPLAIPAARIQQARRAVRCTVDEVGTLAQEHSVHALGNGRTLVMMGCGSGAYNVSTLPLIAWREGGTIRIEPAAFDVSRETIAIEEEREGYSVTNAEFDPATMSIGEWAKGRGLGDCGTAATYTWDGSRFRLTEQKEMYPCQGTTELLTTWRAEVRR